jgi:hypothetical protein
LATHGTYHPAAEAVRAAKALEPGYFRPDERSFSDLLKFLNRLSRHIRYHDLDNRPDGDWHEFFMSDEVFLLADIDSFPLEELERRRVDLLIRFEALTANPPRLDLIRELFGMTFGLVRTVNDWYILSSRFNRNRQSSALELELASAIEHISQGSFLRLKAIRHGAMNADGSYFFAWDDGPLAAVWNKDRPVQVTYLLGFQDNPEQMSSLLKQLMLILKPLYETVSYLVHRTRRIMQDALERQDDHQPHIGLLLAFLQLYRHVRDDINRIPERQLRFYFEQVLGMRRRPRHPDRMLLHFGIDELRAPIRLPAGTRVVAGQDPEGEPRRYLLEREVTLTGARIRSLRTLFVARNPQIDPDSRFQTVTGIHCHEADPDPVRPAAWSALGEEQRFLPPSERTMEDARIGFAVASPTLRLRGGDRVVDITLRFTEASFHYLTTLLIDIANQRRLRPAEVFRAVFDGSVRTAYTTDEGWVEAADAGFIPPDDWDERRLVLRIRIPREAAPLTAYREAVHALGLEADQPLIRVTLDGTHAYHPYTHLQFLELEELGIAVRVEDLRNLHLHNSSGPVDDGGPFEILGATPRKGSFLLIGNDEVFAKRIDSLQIGWEYPGLPLDDAGLKGYFAAYPYPITNASFKLRISARSDHRFHPRDPDAAQTVDMFESVKRSKAVSPQRLIEAVDLERLRIRHDPDLQDEDLEDYNARKALGWIRLELASPDMGFGYEVYSAVYNAAISRSAEVQAGRKGRKLSFETPRDPFTPMAENLFLNYGASTRIHFAPGSAHQNDPEARNAFYHLHPFGHARLYGRDGIRGSALVPYLPQQGALRIGLSDIAPGDTLSLLFELEPNDKWSAGSRPDIRWTYLSHDAWKPLRPEQLLFDETNGLIHSGILSLELPGDITDDNDTQGRGCYWISAEADRRAEMVSRIRRIHADAATARYFDEGKDPDRPLSLPADSVTGLETEVPGILTVAQPLPTYEGRPAEAASDFHQRVSEVLRHKNRAITPWDMERMLLRRFDWLANVRVFGHAGHEDHVAPGQVVVAAIPAIRATDVFYQPVLDPGQMLRMEEYLREVSSPFARITVRNPSYEYLWIKARVVLDSGEVGATLKRLHADLLAHVCPWFHGQPQWAMNMPPLKRSELLGHLQSRPYIRFVTGFSVIRLHVDDEGRYRLRDSAREEDAADELKPAYPWSILVPMAGNRITVVDRPDYHPAEPSSLEDLVIGSNLVLGDDLRPGAATDDRPPEPVAPPDTSGSFRFTLKL